MNKVFDEKIEKMLDDFLRDVYRNSIEYTNPKLILDKLLEFYEQSKYPGIYYRIGYLYEMGVFRKFDKDKSIDYYEKASHEGYVPAMNRLAEYGLLKFIRYDFKYILHAVKSSEDYHDPYGTYLLAKYYLVTGVLEGNHYFKKGLSIMKESAKLGCREAKQFLDDAEVL